MRILPVVIGLLLGACNHGIYTRDGVTDGDAFYLAPSAMANNDPAYQSWVTYSLIKSACQLQLGGKNPARANSFDCELRSRQQLIATWNEKSINNQSISDDYLDTLSGIEQAGFLAEYTVHYFGDKSWLLPGDLKLDGFQRWRQERLRRHRAETRITGSWNFRSQVEN